MVERIGRAGALLVLTLLLTACYRPAGIDGLLTTPTARPAGAAAEQPSPTLEAPATPAPASPDAVSHPPDQHRNGAARLDAAGAHAADFGRPALALA
ncbi:MAG: hypothetical protein M5R40_21590 [Anaerolineae bacterium]|nr:hypothetical protein [Anaerolineae bacterium]